jgi:hypothetical protein
MVSLNYKRTMWYKKIRRRPNYLLYIKMSVSPCVRNLTGEKFKTNGDLDLGPQGGLNAITTGVFI